VHNFLHSKATYELTAMIKLRLGCPEDTAANRIAARYEGQDVLRRETKEGQQWYGMRIDHQVRHLAHAVNLVFIPDQDDILANDVTKSAVARSQVKKAKRGRSFLQRLMNVFHCRPSWDVPAAEVIERFGAAPPL
jgi:hypothetical protein